MHHPCPRTSAGRARQRALKQLVGLGVQRSPPLPHFRSPSQKTLFTGPYRGTENARLAARARPARSNTRPAREPGR
eukprot:958583-Prymnesium_polylepis.1